MLEHHVNKFGPRRRTEGCLLLIFGLRAASKESTRGGDGRSRVSSPTMFGLRRDERGCYPHGDHPGGIAPPDPNEK